MASLCPAAALGASAVKAMEGTKGRLGPRVSTA